MTVAVDWDIKQHNKQTNFMFIIILQVPQKQTTIFQDGERRGSVVECLSRDPGASGSNLTSVTALCP